MDKISFYLRDRGETVCVAESVTSGFLQLAFSQMPFAQDFYSGGITTYTAKQKIKHLNIEKDLAKVNNCVSREITEKMAINVSLLFDTEWALSTTGYATPTDDSKEQIFAYYSIAYRGVIIRSDRIELHPLTKAIDAQHFFMEYVLGCFRCEIKRNHSHIKI